MSYVCAHSNEVVQNQKLVLFPLVTRKVKYDYFTKSFNKRNNSWDEFYQYSSEGTEIVKEAKVSKDNFEKYLLEHSTSVEGEKTVKVFITKPKVKFVAPESEDEWEKD